MPPIIHHYLAIESDSSSTQSTLRQDGLNLQALDAQHSAALEMIIQLAHKLANHPSILNSISLVLRYGWSNDEAKLPLGMDEVATEQELALGRQFINGQWPEIYADESNPDPPLRQAGRNPDLRDKIFINLSKVQDLATALAQSPPSAFQVEAHALLGAVTVIHEASHAFRLKHFASRTEAQAPPAYQTINDGTAPEDQISWKIRFSFNGNVGTWVEDSGIGGVLASVVSEEMPSKIHKVLCERATVGPRRIVALHDEHVHDIFQNPTSTKWLPIGIDYESDGPEIDGEGLVTKLRTIPPNPIRTRPQDCFYEDETPPLH